MPGAPSFGVICCTCARYGERVLRSQENILGLIYLFLGISMKISNHPYVPGFLERTVLDSMSNDCSSEHINKLSINVCAQSAAHLRLRGPSRIVPGFSHPGPTVFLRRMSFELANRVRHPTHRDLQLMVTLSSARIQLCYCFFFVPRARLFWCLYSQMVIAVTKNSALELALERKKLFNV